MTSSCRPLRCSVSCRSRPCSVSSAIRRQEPRRESRTTIFFTSQTVAPAFTGMTRSSPVRACRSVTSTGGSCSSSSAGTRSTCSSKTRRTCTCFCASSRADIPPAPQMRMSAPRSSSRRLTSASPRNAASIRGVVSWLSPRSLSAPCFISIRTIESRASSPVPPISRTASSSGVSPMEFCTLGSVRACSSTLMVSTRRERLPPVFGAMRQRCSRLWPSASWSPTKFESFLLSCLNELQISVSVSTSWAVAAWIMRMPRDPPTGCLPFSGSWGALVSRSRTTWPLGGARSRQRPPPTSTAASAPAASSSSTSLTSSWRQASARQVKPFASFVSVSALARSNAEHRRNRNSTGAQAASRAAVSSGGSPLMLACWGFAPCSSSSSRHSA
mmetsp:Transcript_13564/g.39575  ORF Transcript_13564/g.39575 Transcript_13564/m.39575 type:complete len:386 (-) Transcript_13564:325-1482(-)